MKKRAQFNARLFACTIYYCLVFFSVQNGIYELRNVFGYDAMPRANDVKNKELVISEKRLLLFLKIIDRQNKQRTKEEKRFNMELKW